MTDRSQKNNVAIWSRKNDITIRSLEIKSFLFGLADGYNIYYVAKSHRTPIAVLSKGASHVTNRMSDLPLLLLQRLPFGVGSPLSSGTLLAEFVSILPVAW